jgi:hypothetical protein
MTDRNGVVAHDKADKLRAHDLEGLTTRDRLVHQCLIAASRDIYRSRGFGILCAR